MADNYSLTAISIIVLTALICITRVAETRTKFDDINDDGKNKMVSSSQGYKDDDDICQSIVEPQGYACENHQVTTEDGYILEMQRIPTGCSGQKADKPPVLLQHGIFSDARTWMYNSPDESLAFILADNGFDVWLSNTRGTAPSSGHQSLAPSDSDYWDWSWDELAAYDLQAFLQYVHDQTGQQVHYAAHSLGTLMALAALSQNNLLNMMRSAALLCPIAYLSLIPSPLTQAGAKLFLAEELYWLGVHEFGPQGQQSSQLVSKICDLPGIDCSNLLTSFTGPNCCMNTSKPDSFAEPTATKNLIHLAQMIRTGTIEMYDYGDDNMKHYGQLNPPTYDMTKIPNDFPLFLSYGGQDKLSDVNDVQILLDNLKDHDNDKLVVQLIEDYAHLDFVKAVNANQEVYYPMIGFFSLH